MAFEVIPAIDVAGGRLARITRAGSSPVEAFGGDPIRAAEAFAVAGARWVHVVDLDLAGTGRPVNLEVVRAVAGLGVEVQASGGVASRSHAEALLAAGASRVVLGSVALAAREQTEEILSTMGGSLVVGIEADGPRIVPRGSNARELPLWDTLGWLGALDVRRYLFTEVGRVGALEGPDLDGVWALATHTGRPVIASGGVRGLDDLRALAGLGGTVEGAVVGRALHEGALDLREAIAALG
jgi:phosphoribosylformimino-5-aminoimidazole carboxamide ribotide isomerase